MLLLVQQLLPVMLPVDIHQAAAQLTQLGHCHRARAHATDVLAIGVDLTLEQQIAVLIGGNAQILAEGGGHMGKPRADESLVSTGADQITGGALSQDGTHRVDNNGLTCTRLTGQGVKTTGKGNLTALNDGNILNMQHFQHGTHLPSSKFLS